MAMDLVSTKLNRLEEVCKCNPSQETTKQQKCDEKKKFKRKKSKHRRARHRPYAAKNFLGRPKINAPANTTQFLCNDKDYYCEESLTKNPGFVDRLSSAGTNSESESSLNTSSSTQQPDLPNDDDTYELAYFDEYKFCAEGFDQMYDDIRAELLRNESVEELSARCLELESAVHNLQYLLKRETEKRKKMEEVICLRQMNKNLHKENNQLQQNSKLSLTLVAQASNIKLDDKSDADNVLHIPEYVGS